MTLKQDTLAKEILTSTTLREAGLKAGYSKVSRKIYSKGTKRYIAKIFQEQGVTKDSLKLAYEDCLELCRKKEDYSTLKATIDSLAKLYGFARDITSTNVGIFGLNSKDIADLPITEPPKAQEVTEDNPSKL